MPPIRQGRLAIRRPALGLEAPALGPVPVSAPALMAPPNDLLQEFIQTCIERVRNQALAAPAASAAEVRDCINRPLKSRNSDLYYGHLQMECYYFC